MNKPKIVSITGGSGSGKTLFIKELLKRLPSASVHSMDNYYINIERQPIDDEGIENFDTLDSIDLEKYVADLRSLCGGKSIELEEYQFNKAGKKKILKIEVADVILVEGIFVLYLEEIRKMSDLKLFIEAPDYLMLKRRIIRDADERGYDLQDVLYRYEHHVKPAYNSYIGPSREWADLIIPNHQNFNRALDVVTAFLNQ